MLSILKFKSTILIFLKCRINFWEFEHCFIFFLIKLVYNEQNHTDTFLTNQFEKF